VGPVTGNGAVTAAQSNAARPRVRVLRTQGGGHVQYIDVQYIDGCGGQPDGGAIVPQRTDSASHPLRWSLLP
jgi:hypothetical protein